MSRCICSADMDADPTHDTGHCAGFRADVEAAVAYARTLGLPTDRAARLVGAIGTEIPPPARRAAVLAALDAWATTEDVTA